MTDPDKAALKAEIMRERGYWSRFHEVLLERAPEFLQAYVLFQATPTRGRLLPQKLCELIYVAIDVSVNHMYERGGRRHMDFALKAGATPEEVLQTILIATVVAAHHPLDAGLSILRDELGGAQPRAALDDAAGAAKDAYVALTGHWPESGDFMLAHFPETARSYMAYGAAAWQGPLGGKERELIALAVCAAPTCLFEAGIRRHIRGALAAGASAGEIATALQLAAALSIHTCTIGIPGLDDVLSGRPLE